VDTSLDEEKVYWGYIMRALKGDILGFLLHCRCWGWLASKDRLGTKHRRLSFRFSFFTVAFI